MKLNINKNDSGELMLAKIKSYLLYPEKENKELREQAEFSFFLDEVEYDFRAIKKTETINSDFLNYLNDCPPITYFDDRFYDRKHQMFTAGILMRLIISGERYRPKKMSLTLAAKIFSGQYKQELGTEKIKKIRTTHLSSTKNHWKEMNGVQHLCAAWYCCKPQLDRINTDLKEECLTFLAIADRIYRIQKEQVNSWRKKPLMTPDTTWLIPNLPLPEIEEKELKILTEEKFNQYYEQFGKPQKKKK